MKIQPRKEKNSRKTILLVEDQEILRRMMSEILLNDYDVTVAENGIEALEIFEKNKNVFDLLITDFNMPQMNGRELSEKFEAVGGAKEVLFISGFIDDDDFSETLINENKHFLAKPFTPDDLSSTVKKIVGDD